MIEKVNPLTPIDLISFPKGSEIHFDASTRAKEIQKIHEQVKAKIEHVKLSTTYTRKRLTSIARRLSLNLEISYGCT